MARPVYSRIQVQYYNARGMKGGIRFIDETIDTVRALGAWMTWKTSIVDVPLAAQRESDL